MDHGNGSGSEAVTRHLPCMGIRIAKTDMGGEECIVDYPDP